MRLNKLVPAAFVVGACLLSRGDAQTSPPEEGRRVPVLACKPAAKELAAAVEDVKKGVLPRVWDSKLDKDELGKRKYLDKWQVVTSEHYAVFTNGPTASCKKYSVTLEDLYATIKKDLPFTDLDHLLVAYIFSDEEDYYRYAERITGYQTGYARKTAGHANSQYYATYYSAPRDAVVFHEATHQIVGACLKVTGVGSWFQEGIAVYYENRMTNEKLDGDVRADIKRGDYYPLPQFIAIESLLGDPAGNGHRNYAHAGALVNFMINTKVPGAAGKFQDFLAEARKGYGFARGKEASVRVINGAYGVSVEEFEKLWLEHLKIAK